MPAAPVPAPPPPTVSGGLSESERRVILSVGMGTLLGIFIVAVLLGRFVGSVSTVSGLDQGECVRDFFSTAGGTSEISLVQTTSCTEPHALEVFAVAPDFWPADPVPHPGMSQLFEEAERWCGDHFEAFVGEPFDTSALGMWTFVPIVEGWADGDRSVQCLVGASDEMRLTTGTLQGDALRVSS